MDLTAIWSIVKNHNVPRKYSFVIWDCSKIFEWVCNKENEGRHLTISLKTGRATGDLLRVVDR